MVLLKAMVALFAEFGQWSWLADAGTWATTRSSNTFSTNGFSAATPSYVFSGEDLLHLPREFVVTGGFAVLT